MKIKISNKEVLIDKSSKKLVDKYPWHIESGHGYVVYRGLIKKSNGKYYKPKKYLHRLIVDARDNDIVDHINGNKLDNRLVNLRKVNKSINGFNRNKIQTNNISGYTGVCKRGNIWRAYISRNGKQYYLGVYKTKQEAISARRAGEKIVYGEYV